MGVILFENDSLSTRALKLAQLAFAEFVNDRNGMTDRAAWRIVQALEKYQDFDKKKENDE